MLPERSKRAEMALIAAARGQPCWERLAREHRSAGSVPHRQTLAPRLRAIFHDGGHLLPGRYPPADAVCQCTRTGDEVRSNHDFPGEFRGVVP
jgi:hypothetical protein